MYLRSRQLWALFEDYQLWNNRDSPVSQLSMLHRRTITAINYRLRYLRSDRIKQISMSIPKYTIQCTHDHGYDNQCQKWNDRDDACLWLNRDCCYFALSKTFGRTEGSIMRRLQKLSELPGQQEISWKVLQRSEKPKSEHVETMIKLNAVHRKFISKPASFSQKVKELIKREKLKKKLLVKKCDSKARKKKDRKRKRLII